MMSSTTVVKRSTGRMIIGSGKTKMKRENDRGIETSLVVVFIYLRRETRSWSLRDYDWSETQGVY